MKTEPNGNIVPCEAITAPVDKKKTCRFRCGIVSGVRLRMYEDLSRRTCLAKRSRCATIVTNWKERTSN